MKYKTYSKYKDTGVEWIGKVPEGWRVNRLKYLSRIIDGDRGNEYPDENDFRESGIPFISTEQLKNNKLEHYSGKFISEEKYKKLGSGKVKKNDVLLSVRGTIGNCTLFKPREYTTAFINAQIMILRTRECLNPELLYYTTLSKYWAEQLNYESYGSAQKQLSNSILGDISIVEPSLPEQQSIASFLDKKTAEIDALIDRDRRLIDLLREKRASLINHAVTKGLDPKAKMKDSGVEWIGEIPEGWDVRRLKHLLLPGIDGMKMGPFGSQLKLEMMAEKGYKVYGQENVINNDFTLGTRFIDEVKFKELSVYEIMPGDLLISTMGTIGNCRITPKDIETGIMDSHLIRMRIESDLVNNEYLAIILNDSAYSFYNIMKLSKGSIMTGLNSEIISNLTILVPPVSEQSKIVSYVNKSTSKIDFAVQKNPKRIDLMEEYKKSLIHHTVTGAIDVRGVS